jgi:hypothetical protein
MKTILRGLGTATPPSLCLAGGCLLFIIDTVRLKTG